MIVQRQHSATLGTAKPSIAPMAKKDTDALVFRIEDDLLDGPGPIQAPSNFVKRSTSRMVRNPLYLCPCVHYKLPTAKSEGPPLYCLLPSWHDSQFFIR